MRFDTKMPAPNAVAVSQTTTFRMPIGRRYHSVTLIGLATTFGVADITEIRVLLNDKVIQRFSGTERNVLNMFDGREDATVDATSFKLVLPFDRYGILTRDGEEFTALNTGSVDPNTGASINAFTIEVDINANPTGTLSLVAYAQQSEALAGGPGAVPYLLKATYDYAGAGTYEMSDFPRGGSQSQFIDAIYLKPSANLLDNFEILADNAKIFERTASLNEKYERDGIRIPQAGWNIIDRTEWGYAGDPFDLRGLQDFRLKADVSGAMTVTRLVRYIGGVSV